MIGRRVEYDAQILAPGEYVVGEPWYACTPNGMLANLAAHQKIVHEDGTLTVQPSIECGSGIKRVGDRERIDPGVKPYWHGYLERGVWREV